MPAERTLRAQSDDGGALLTGKAVRRAEDVWRIELASASGTRCEGDLVWYPDRKLEGPVACSDGAKGTIRLLFNGHRGAGAAEVGRHSYLVVIGD